MSLLLALLVVLVSAERATFHASNLLQKSYNNPNYLNLLEADKYLLNDDLRLGRNIEFFQSTIPTAAFFHQEVSDTTPCLNNESIILVGSYPTIKAAQEARGFVCSFAANDMTYWSKYFDYDGCDAFNSWMLSGNVLCLNTSDFSDITFFPYRLSTGSFVAAANATFRGTVPMVLGSIHIDSDVAGIRRKEFKDLRARFNPYGDRVVVLAGDYNTGWSSSNLQTEFASSGYLDPMWYLKQTNGSVIFSRRSQPLTNGWYGSDNHVDEQIDHVLFSPARVSVVTQVSVPGMDHLYGYPNATLTGVLDCQQWTTFPEIYSYDTNEPYRIAANLRTSGSDHYAVVVTVDVV